MRSLSEALAQFRPHPPAPETAARHEQVAAIFEATVRGLWDVVPDGPEKTLALRALQQASMLSNVAIAITGPATDSGPAILVTTRPDVTTLQPSRHTTSGVVHVTVDGHRFFTAPGAWAVLDLREEMGILPDRDLWIASGDSIARTLLHLNETVLVQAGHVFFTTLEQPPAAARLVATSKEGKSREYEVRDVEGPLERNEVARRGDPIMQIPAVVHVDNRGALLRPGTWTIPELREALSVSAGWDLWVVDFYSVRIPLHNTETVTVHDGQRFETTLRKPERADVPS